MTVLQNVLNDVLSPVIGSVFGGGAAVFDRTGLSLTPDYVIDDNVGSDAAAGSEAAPWQSLNKITTSILVEGGTVTVLVKAGTYDKVSDVIAYGPSFSDNTSRLNIVFEPGCVIDGEAYTTANSTGSAFSPNGFGINAYLFGNFCEIKNFTQGTGNGLGGSSGVGQYNKYWAYDFNIHNCVDGVSCHGNITARFDRVWAYDCLKAACAHINTTDTYHYQCRFEEIYGGGTGNFVLNTSSGDSEFYDCELIPYTNGRAVSLGKVMQRCRIGTLTRKVNVSGSNSGGPFAISDCFVHINGDTARYDITFERCYGRMTWRTRNGGSGFNMVHCIISDHALGNSNIFYSNYNPGSATKMDIKDNIFETDSAAAFMSYDSLNSGYLVAALSEFHHNVLSGSAAFDADLIAADTGGLVIQDNVTGDALIGSANTYDPDDYAYAAGSPAIGAAQDGGNCGFGVGEVAAPNLTVFP